jgi:hypothetical protein
MIIEFNINGNGKFIVSNAFSEDDFDYYVNSDVFFEDLEKKTKVGTMNSFGVFSDLKEAIQMVKLSEEVHEEFGLSYKYSKLLLDNFKRDVWENYDKIQKCENYEIWLKDCFVWLYKKGLDFVIEVGVSCVEDESNFNLTDIELRNKIDVKFMLISEAELELWEIECDKMLSLIEKQT